MEEPEILILGLIKIEIHLFFPEFLGKLLIDGTDEVIVTDDANVPTSTTQKTSASRRNGIFNEPWLHLMNLYIGSR